MYSLDCQIKDIMERLPITFVIGDVTTLSNISTNVNLSSFESNSPNPFLNDSNNSPYNNLSNIDIHPGSLNRIDNNTTLGERSLPPKPPMLTVEHVSLPKIYLKFLFLAAEPGDIGNKGIDGKPGSLGDAGPAGPTGVNGYTGTPPLYMQ